MGSLSSLAATTVSGGGVRTATDPSISANLSAWQPSMLCGYYFDSPIHRVKSWLKIGFKALTLRLWGTPLPPSL
jgi:hypothetical protein